MFWFILNPYFQNENCSEWFRSSNWNASVLWWWGYRKSFIWPMLNKSQYSLLNYVLLWYFGREIAVSSVRINKNIKHIEVWDWNLVSDTKGRNVDLERLRIGCWEYLDLRAKKWQEDRGNCIVRSFVTCVHRQILLGWSSQGPVPMAARSRASTVFGRSNIGIAGSNTARSMDVCLCFSVLCCPVCR
jgi:hypothetical protein